MSLPFLFGVITYLFIIFFLTAWLTKHHKRHIHDPDSKNHSDDREEYFKNETIGPETRDSKTTPSGKKSLVKDETRRC